jgi:acetyl-CoA carboxylase carboxyl transferase subunit alpha
VISPEGCAAILFHDATKAQVAAEALKITAQDLKDLKVIDEIIPEPLGGAHKDPDVTAGHLKSALIKYLKTLSELPAEKLLKNRYEKYRKIGSWQERKSPSPRQSSKKKKSSN